MEKSKIVDELINAFKGDTNCNVTVFLSNEHAKVIFEALVFYKNVRGESVEYFMRTLMEKKSKLQDEISELGETLLKKQETLNEIKSKLNAIYGVNGLKFD